MILRTSVQLVATCEIAGVELENRFSIFSVCKILMKGGSVRRFNKKKASRILGVLQRNSLSSWKGKGPIIRSLVRPMAEYAAAAWSPNTTRDLNSIEIKPKKSCQICTWRHFDRTRSVT